MIFLTLVGEILAGIFVGTIVLRFSLEKAVESEGKVAEKLYLQSKSKLTLAEIISSAIMYLIFAYVIFQDSGALIFLGISIIYILRGILILNKFDKYSSKIVKSEDLVLFNIIFFFQNIGFKVFSAYVVKSWVKK